MAPKPATQTEPLQRRLAWAKQASGVVSTCLPEVMGVTEARGPRHISHGHGLYLWGKRRTVLHWFIVVQVPTIQIE